MRNANETVKRRLEPMPKMSLPFTWADRLVTDTGKEGAALPGELTELS